MEILQSWGLQIAYALLLAFILFICKKLYTKMVAEHDKQKIENEKNKVKQDFMMMGIQSLLYFRICEQSNMYLKRGYMTRQESKDLDYFFTSYSNLGGNGVAKRLFNSCCELPIKED